MVDFVAIVLILCVWETLHILIWEIFRKKIEEKTQQKITAKKVIFYVGSLFVTFLILSIPLGIYNVPENTATVVTTITGEKIIKDTPGIRWRGYLFTSTENYDLRKTVMYFPYTEISVGLTTKDNKVVSILTSLFYKISDLDEYAIKSKDTNTKIYLYLTSAVTEEIKAHTYEEIKSERAEIEQNILSKLKETGTDLGIEISDFKFVNAVDTSQILKAKEEAQQSESLIKLAENEKLAFEIKSEAELQRGKKLNELSPEVLEYLAKMELYHSIEKGLIDTIVIPNNEIGLTLGDNEKPKSI